MPEIQEINPEEWQDEDAMNPIYEMMGLTGPESKETG